MKVNYFYAIFNFLFSISSIARCCVRQTFLRLAFLPFPDCLSKVPSSIIYFICSYAIVFDISFQKKKARESKHLPSIIKIFLVHFFFQFVQTCITKLVNSFYKFNVYISLLCKIKKIVFIIFDFYHILGCRFKLKTFFSQFIHVNFIYSTPI